jgi:hypothetical protein
VNYVWGSSKTKVDCSQQDVPGLSQKVLTRPASVKVQASVASTCLATLRTLSYSIWDIYQGHLAGQMTVMIKMAIVMSSWIVTKGKRLKLALPKKVKNNKLWKGDQHHRPIGQCK